MARIDRRSFLKKTAAAGAALGGALAGARSILGAPAVDPLGAVPGAAEKIRIGLIGCGGMGQGDLLTFLKCQDVDCTALCDVDDRQVARAARAVEEARSVKLDGVRDYRKVLDRKDVDACLVATPDHWHALPTIHACEAGKDVYVEKPLSTSILEGRAMVEAARKHGRVVQAGTQWRSGEHYRDAAEFVRSGKLGRIRLVRAWAYLNWVGDIGKPADEPAPKTVDYDFWLGPAPQRPFNRARFHFNFRWFWDYAGGLMTDWGVHLINIALWALPEKGPRTASSTGGKFAIDDIQETPDTQVALFEFPGFALLWEHQVGGGIGPNGREHGVAFTGTEGTLTVDAGGWSVAPEKGKPLPEKKASGSADARLAHVKNFLDCMRTREMPVSDVEICHRATAVGHLGNIALRTGKKVLYDPEKETIEGMAEPEPWLRKPYRAPWKLPRSE